MVNDDKKEVPATITAKKETLPVLVKNMISKGYNEAVVAGALAKEGLLQKYEKQFNLTKDGVKVEDEMTGKEFETKIKEFLNMKV